MPEMTKGTELIAHVAELLDMDGWRIEVEKAQDGLLLDVHAVKGSAPSLVVECKAYRQLVGLRSAREFASIVTFLRESDPTLQAWLVTTNGFTSNAMAALREHQIQGFTVAELQQKLGRLRRKPSKEASAWETDVDQARGRGKRVFVIMPFSDEMLDVFILGIRWAASALGVVAERADDLEHNGEIICEVREAIRDYAVVVGDTSGANPNVCYEVGYAHALDKPTILICRKGEQLPFDLQGTNHLIYPNVLGLREPLKARLAAALGREPSAGE
ncbi:restriction endonuclease [Candidatus Bipolaricaulota bacterium]